MAFDPKAIIKFLFKQKKHIHTWVFMETRCHDCRAIYIDYFECLICFAVEKGMRPLFKIKNKKINGKYKRTEYILPSHKKFKRYSIDGK